MSEEKTAEAKYPELTKLRAVKDESQKLGEFLEWLKEHGFTICETYNNSDSLRDGEYFPMRKSTTDLLALYFEIDMEKVETEKRSMIDEHRELARTQGSGR